MRSLAGGYHSVWMRALGTDNLLETAQQAMRSIIEGELDMGSAMLSYAEWRHERADDDLAQQTFLFAVAAFRVAQRFYSKGVLGPELELQIGRRLNELETAIDRATPVFR